MPGERSFDERPGAELKALLRAALAFAVFPNALFAAAGIVLYTTRPIINVDYAALGAVWLWLPLWARVAGFAALFTLDGVNSSAAMYNINPLAGIVALRAAPFGLLLTVFLGVVLAVGSAVLIARFAVRFLADRRRRYYVLACMAAFVAVALFAQHNIAGSATVHFARETKDRIASARPRAFPVEAATDSLRAATAAGRVGDHNIALVLVESLGVLQDSGLSAYVWAPLLEDAAIAAKYRIRRGDVAFRGGTTSGELRELCGIFADYITLPDEVLPGCLPRRLHALGYTTYALHGYEPGYYHRARWYPKLFARRYFDEQLDSIAAAGRRCGTQFRGICDRDAFVLFERLLFAEGRNFVYWLTLDAHTPVELARRREFAVDWDAHMAGREMCGTAPEVCVQALFWRDSFERLARVAADAGLPTTRFVIAGDHAPAFVRRGRARAFLPGRVPYAELLPRP